jgi:hypothetical protein
MQIVVVAAVAVVDAARADRVGRAAAEVLAAAVKL